MNEFTFYATFGTGQPGFPGYLECKVKAPSEQHAEDSARKRFREATENRYCMIYRSLDDMHELDRVYRGKC